VYHQILIRGDLIFRTLSADLTTLRISDPGDQNLRFVLVVQIWGMTEERFLGVECLGPISGNLVSGTDFWESGVWDRFLGIWGVWDRFLRIRGLEAVFSGIVVWRQFSQESRSGGSFWGFGSSESTVWGSRNRGFRGPRKTGFLGGLGRFLKSGQFNAGIPPQNSVKNCPGNTAVSSTPINFFLTHFLGRLAIV